MYLSWRQPVKPHWEGDNLVSVYGRAKEFLIDGRFGLVVERDESDELLPGRFYPAPRTLETIPNVEDDSGDGTLTPTRQEPPLSVTLHLEFTFIGLVAIPGRLLVTGVG